MKKLILVFGGKSAEHEVSLKSAKNIFNAINANLFETILVGISKQGSWYKFNSDDVFKTYSSLNDNELQKSEAESVTLICSENTAYLYSLQNHSRIKVDVAFPIIHGTMGEDGTLQGLFKMNNLPFVGCGVLSSSIGMDKVYMKKILSEAGIPNAKYVVLNKNSFTDYKNISDCLGIPFFIKPANAGSSVGVHKIKNETDFKKSLTDALLYDHKILAEEFIEGKEIECSVMGLNENPSASLPGELIIHHEFYSYEAKYIDENGAEIKIPANIDQNKITEVQNLAIKTFKILGCDGITRVDFFIKKDNTVYINEINTLPGFTQISMYPKMWEASGIKYSELITKLIDFAFQKHQIDTSLKLSFQ